MNPDQPGAIVQMMVDFIPTELLADESSVRKNPYIGGISNPRVGIPMKLKAGGTVTLVQAGAWRANSVWEFSDGDAAAAVTSVLPGKAFPLHKFKSERAAIQL